jgi:hypothetical protein
MKQEEDYTKKTIKYRHKQYNYNRPSLPTLNTSELEGKKLSHEECGWEGAFLTFKNGEMFPNKRKYERLLKNSVNQYSVMVDNITRF